MKAFALEAPGRASWYNAPKPELVPYGAILRPIMVAPCTSDVHTVYGGGSPKSSHLILGHECIAQILEVGEYVNDFRNGEIVAVPAITPDWRALSIQEGNYKHAGVPFSGHQLGRTQPGVFAEQFLVKDADTTLAKIPVGISLEQALMCVDAVTTGFTGAENANIKFGDRVCVIGIGPIGLMAVKGASLLGASEIYAVGSRSICMDRAKLFGASKVLNYKDGNIVERVKNLTEGIGVDATIICGGNDNTFAQAVDMTRYGIGTISNVNYFGGSGNLPFPKFSGGRGMGGKTLHTELANGGRVRIERLMRMVKCGRVDPSPLITHRLYGMDSIELALNMMRYKTDNLIKVVIKIDWDNEELWKYGE